MKFWCGIDPGKQGAMARIFEDGRVQILDTPLLHVGHGKGGKGTGKTLYDEGAMRALLWEHVLIRETPVALTVLAAPLTLEDVHAIPRIPGRPGVSTTTMFEMGEGKGIWRGLLTGLQVPYQLATPQRWKKTLLDGQPKTDEGVVAAASRLYPSAYGLLRGPKGGLKVDRADALLLAHFARVTGG